MKKIIVTLLLSLTLVGGGVLLPIEDGYAGSDRREKRRAYRAGKVVGHRRSERRHDRRDRRRAYAAGAVVSHRRHERREYRRDRYDEREERYERRERRRNVAGAVIAIGAAAAIINATKD